MGASFVVLVVGLVRCDEEVRVAFLDDNLCKGVKALVREGFREILRISSEARIIGDLVVLGRVDDFFGEFAEVFGFVYLG